MKIRKQLLPVLFIVFLQGTVSAQISIGARVLGPQFSNFTNSVGVYRDPANAMYGKTSLTGLLAGFSFRMNIKNQHYFCTELLYSMRGESGTYKAGQLNGYSATTLPSMGQGSIEYYLEYRTNYIEIPFLYCIDLTHRAGYGQPVHIYLSSGFSAGINMVSNLSKNSFSISSPGSYFSGIGEHFQSTKVLGANPVILNFVTDIEAEVRQRKATRYFAYGRFNHSLTNVYSAEVRNMKTTMLTLGFGFGVRRYFKS